MLSQASGILGPKASPTCKVATCCNDWTLKGYMFRHLKFKLLFWVHVTLSKRNLVEHDFQISNYNKTKKDVARHLQHRFVLFLRRLCGWLVVQLCWTFWVYANMFSHSHGTAEKRSSLVCGRLQWFLHALRSESTNKKVWMWNFYSWWCHVMSIYCCPGPRSSHFPSHILEDIANPPGTGHGMVGKKVGKMVYEMIAPPLPSGWVELQGHQDPRVCPIQKMANKSLWTLPTSPEEETVLPPSFAATSGWPENLRLHIWLKSFLPITQAFCEFKHQLLQHFHARIPHHSTELESIAHLIPCAPCQHFFK